MKFWVAPPKFMPALCHGLSGSFVFALNGGQDGIDS